MLVYQATFVSCAVTGCGLDATLGPQPVPDELPASVDDLAMIKFLLTGYPDPLQQPFGQKVCQPPAIPAVRLDPGAILLGDQARRRNYAFKAMRFPNRPIANFGICCLIYKFLAHLINLPAI
jgi:hypothetical protein